MVPAEVVAQNGLSVQAGGQKRQPHRMVNVRCVNGCCLRVGDSYVRRGVGKAQCAAHARSPRAIRDSYGCV
jgi:hypothetical protein